MIIRFIVFVAMCVAIQRKGLETGKQILRREKGTGMNAPGQAGINKLDNPA
jgi:hypothetical protein